MTCTPISIPKWMLIPLPTPEDGSLNYLRDYLAATGAIRLMQTGF